MAFESLTDDKIKVLLSSPKQIRNPHAKNKTKSGHQQVNFRAVATDGSGHEFGIYKRQNLRNGMEDDFSCGICWFAPNGETLTLKRYNGPNHDHQNTLEKEMLGNTCHIHIATEKYIKANRKAEGYAVPTNKYNTLEGALYCLVKECNISGIRTTPDNTGQTKLFDNEP